MTAASDADRCGDPYSGIGCPNPDCKHGWAASGADQPTLRDQLCTCGHPRSMHGRRPSRCMAMSSPSTFWDDCEEFTPARSEADSFRDRLIEAMPREWSTYLIRQRIADALLPLIEADRERAKAEALDDAAAWVWDQPRPYAEVWHELRDRAEALRAGGET